MNFLRLNCKVITPMFMYGADGKTPELRPSEFKGMMRWWWRAIKSTNNIDELREDEEKIFGGSGEKVGKSKIFLNINYNLKKEDISKYQPLPHHNQSNCKFCKDQCRKSFKLDAFKPGTNFEMIFSFSEKNERLESLIYLIFILGGFGKRSRRGFGSVEIKEEKKEYLKLDVICSKLNKIEVCYEIKENKIISKKSLNTIYPNLKEVIIGKEFVGYDEILKAIGEASHKYRDPSLGYGNPRMGSPIYVSVIERNSKYLPIISILSINPPPNYPKYNLDKQNNFIRELII